MQALDNQFRLSRLNIFLFSFRQARQFARYILRKRRHAVKTPTALAKLVRLAFNTSLIVSYARPFHKSNEPDGLPRVSLKAYVDLLDENEKKLHEKVIIKRDEVFAHSDARAHEIEGLNYAGPGLKLYKSAFDPLTTDETRLLLRMIDKWIIHLESLRAKARPPIGPVNRNSGSDF